MKNNPLIELGELFSKIEVTERKAKAVSFEDAVPKVSRAILKCAKRGNKVMIIGNGGSASIASHMDIDFLKNGKISALLLMTGACLPV